MLENDEIRELIANDSIFEVDIINGYGFRTGSNQHFAVYTILSSASISPTPIFTLLFDLLPPEIARKR